MKTHNTFEFPKTLIVNLIGIKSPKSYDVGDLIKVICYNIYGIENCTINVIQNDTLIKKFSTDELEIGAILDKSSIEHTYNLYLASRLNDSLEIIICHELCHLKQYESGDLKIIRNNKTHKFLWMGKEFVDQCDY